MRLSLLFLFIIAFSACPAQNQSEKNEVLQVVQQFFDALKSRDTVAFKNVSLADAQSYIVQERSDSVFVRSRNQSRSVRSLSQGKEIIIERMRDKGVQVQIHNRIAMVWAPYDLWLDEKFSHCGVDVFTLVKTNKGWKIATIAYTIEKEGCTTK